jgi:ribosomal protein S18 acetylase RimI-like enzyme
VTIRPAEPGDAKAVAEVFLAARAGMTYLPELHTAAETRGWVRDVLLRDHEVWIAEVDSRVAGFAALSDDFLEHIYVHPQAQGRGLGTVLLALSKARRPEGLRLWVFQKNEGARRLYERHGFELVELTDGAGNEEREPDALYEWVERRPGSSREKVSAAT